MSRRLLDNISTNIREQYFKLTTEHVHTLLQPFVLLNFNRIISLRYMCSIVTLQYSIVVDDMVCGWHHTAKQRSRRDEIAGPG